MQRQMTEEEIIASFDQAIAEGQIYLVYQPQYNHSTGRLVGAEGLMRLLSEKSGLTWQKPFKLWTFRLRDILPGR